MKKRRSLDYDGLDGVLDVAQTTQATSGWRPSYRLVAVVLVGAVGAYISLAPFEQSTETESAVQTIPAKPQLAEKPQQPETQPLPSPAIEQPAAITAEPPVTEESTPAPTQPTNQPIQVATEQTAMTIYFKLDASKPSFSDKNQLQTLVDIAKNCPNQLQLIGHTCNLGAADLNKALGLNRAANLKKLLVTHGIAENKILIASAGMDNPAASNATAQGQALNRRVELICITP